MLKIIYTIFDILFPPRPHELLVRSVTPTILETLFVPRQHEGIHYLYSYQHPLITALITENKFYQNQYAAQLLAAGVSRWLTITLADAMIIPIPLSLKRRKTRGYNQVEEITKRLDQMWRTKVSTTHLQRIRHTTAQTTLTREARFKNMSQAFSVTQTLPTPLPTIVLIDDVTTTGATLKTARAAIQNEYPEAVIILLSLAH